MEKTRKITTILVLAVAFCFVLVSLLQAECLTPSQASNYLVNSVKAVSIPIWKITQEGTAKSVKWVDHAPNPRFAIYDPSTPADETDDVVLDKETGLVWARNANLGDVTTWKNVIGYCRNYVTLGNRMGWRLPTVEELSSLVDPGQSNPALPVGHPFIILPSGYHWSSSTTEISSANAWYVNMHNGNVADQDKLATFYAWPVRGGNGYATGNW
jgi:hypothetical protein